jgi:hypothetical protein
MSLRDPKQSLDTSMSSISNSQIHSQEIEGWKLDINHDGVILNWYSPISKTFSSESYSSPQPLSNSPSKSKPNLFNYFDVVSDGVIFSKDNDH